MSVFFNSILTNVWLQCNLKLKCLCVRLNHSIDFYSQYIYITTYFYFLPYYFTLLFLTILFYLIIILFSAQNYYHVTYLDSPVSRSWERAEAILPFKGEADVALLKLKVTYENSWALMWCVGGLFGATCHMQQVLYSPLKSVLSYLELTMCRLFILLLSLQTFCNCSLQWK